MASATGGVRSIGADSVGTVWGHPQEVEAACQERNAQAEAAARLSTLNGVLKHSLEQLLEDLSTGAADGLLECEEGVVGPALQRCMAKAHKEVLRLQGLESAHNLRVQRMESAHSAALEGGLAELRDGLTKSEGKKAELQATIAELNKKLAAQITMTKNAENDVRLMYKRHKKELQVPPPTIAFPPLGWFRAEGSCWSLELRGAARFGLLDLLVGRHSPRSAVLAVSRSTHPKTRTPHAHAHSPSITTKILDTHGRGATPAPAISPGVWPKAECGFGEGVGMTRTTSGRGWHDSDDEWALCEGEPKH